MKTMSNSSLNNLDRSSFAVRPIWDKYLACNTANLNAQAQTLNINFEIRRENCKQMK